MAQLRSATHLSELKLREVEMYTNSKLTCLMLLISILCNGCATPKLWKATDPNEYIMMKYSEITEEELKQQSVKYVKDDKTQSFYIEKNSFQKLQDYTYRVLGTPVTVVIDTGIIAVFAMAVVVGNLDKAKVR